MHYISPFSHSHAQINNKMRRWRSFGIYVHLRQIVKCYLNTFFSFVVEIFSDSRFAFNMLADKHDLCAYKRTFTIHSQSGSQQACKRTIRRHESLRDSTLAWPLPEFYMKKKKCYFCLLLSLASVRLFELARGEAVSSKSLVLFLLSQ